MCFYEERALKPSTVEGGGNMCEYMKKTSDDVIDYVQFFYYIAPLKIIDFLSAGSGLLFQYF